MLASDGDTPPVPAASEPPTPAPAAVGADPLVGKVLGSYRLTRVLGRGGMGTVYLGEHPIIGSRVAVKVLHPSFCKDTELVSRFFAEARAVNLIGHENIIQVFDLSATEDGAHYCVMELLEGVSLADATAEGPMPLEQFGPILLQVCDALAAAHQKEVIHRDLKPDNIFLARRSGRTVVKVLDFGIAKLRARDTDMRTEVGTILGTPQFMAPEQAGASPIDARADVYSLGIIMYRVATGRLPFDSTSVAEVLIMHVQRPPEPPRAVHPQIPPSFEAVILKALAKKPADRYQSMNEVADAVRRSMEAGHSPPAPKASDSLITSVEKGFGGMAPTAPSQAPPIPAPSAGAAAPFSGVAVTPAFGTVLDRKLGPVMQVKVQVPDREALRQMYSGHISMGGLYIATDGNLPAAFTPIEVVISVGAGGEPAALRAEVVRAVSPKDAAQWGMSPGIGVQFADMMSARRQIERLLAGKGQEAPRQADAEATRVLTQYDRAANATPYEVLHVSPQAEMSEIRRAARKILRESDPGQFRAPTPAQIERLEGLRERVRRSEGMLGDPARRAEHDAASGNFLGVARALAAGLRVDELAGLRKTFLQGRATTEANAQPHMRAAVIAERSGSVAEALRALEKALAIDPLNISLHQRYWALKRQGT